MITNPPQQHIQVHHLALSFIILTLTIYPHMFNISGKCCLVAAYTSEDLSLQHEFIAKFDIIKSEEVFVSRSVSLRSTDDIETNAIGSNSKHRIKFSSLGRQYDMKLIESAHLISKDFNIVALDAEGKSEAIEYDRNDLKFFEGKLDDDPKSRVLASYDRKHRMLTAQILSGYDHIVVEPTYLHRIELKPFNDDMLSDTMLIYNLSDHRQFDLASSDSFQSKLGDFCLATSANNETQGSGSEATKISSSRNILVQQLMKKSKRGIELFSDPIDSKKTRCTLHLVADYLFYQHVGNSEKQTTINYLLALVNRVNQIYLTTQWETGDDKSLVFNNIGFTVQDITIHQNYTITPSDDEHYNMKSDKIWNARLYLDNFSKHSPPKHYCLAHLLTYRQFDSPVLGLAYVASPRSGTIGGICSPTQQRNGSYYKHNTGISTSKGIHGETLITRQADLVMAHELGHNLGAEHDTNGCRPDAAQGGAFLMHPYAVMGFEKNNRFLSNCSRIAIGRVIKRKGPSCFVEVIDNVCGNGVVEDDEECDGGGVGYGHEDPCCDSSCRFTPGSQCSDRHSWCCSKCRIVPAGRQCRPAEEFNCKREATCDGTSAECFLGPPVDDGKMCVGRGVCRQGDCVPFCEARGLHSCLCNNLADACRLCCKQSINGSCFAYDTKSPYLPDGVLCYNGICEKGRCEQPIQDVIQRMWDVIEDINFTTFVKFLRDNIILVILVVSIPLWCLLSHLIDQFDQRIKQDVINTIMKHRKRQKQSTAQSPFLPRLFVGDGNGSTNSLNDLKDGTNIPLKAINQDDPAYQSRFMRLPAHQPTIGFRPISIGFKLPEGEEVVLEPRESVALNSIELPHQSDDLQMDIGNESSSTNEAYDNGFNAVNSYSTQV